MINPVSVILSFASTLLLLAWFKPQAGRAVFGVFFLLMAWGVNLAILLNNPNLFVEAGRNAYIPLYRWFFITVLAWNPSLFAMGLIAFETSVGLLTLSYGRWARFGLGLGALFCCCIAWIGVEALLMPALAIAPLILMRREFPVSIWGLLAARLRRTAAA
jgi:hypothetical protein